MNEVLQYRFVIADDHPLFRGALREAVTGLLAQVEIAEAGTYDELVELLERSSDVDLVLLDLAMPGVRGFSGLDVYAGPISGGAGHSRFSER